MSDEEKTLNEGQESSSVQNSSLTDAGSSNVTTQTEAPASGSEGGEKGASAGSPPAKDDKQAAAPKLADIIKTTLEKGKGNSSDPGKQEQTPPGEKKPDGTKKDGAGQENLTEEEKRLDKIPRFQKVHARMREAEELVKSQSQDVQDYRKMTGFMQQHGLTSAEVRQGFDIMAALKTDPLRAVQMLAPVLQSLNQFTGYTLPQDLQKKVDEGVLSVEDAQTLARTNNQNLLLQQQRAQQQQQTAQEVQNAQHRDHHTNMVNTFAAWEQQKITSDPDFQLKQEFLLPALENEIRRNNPRTPQEAVDLANRVYEGVSAHLRKVLPRRTPIQPPIKGNAPSNNGAPEPKNMAEAIAASLQKTRGLAAS